MSCCDGDAPVFYSEAIVVARKEHKCCECRDTIKRGEKYQRASGRWDYVATFKTCMSCAALRDEYYELEGCSPSFGELGCCWTEHLREAASHSPKGADNG